MSDDELTLPADTLQALLEFKQQENERKAEFHRLSEAAEARAADVKGADALAADTEQVARNQVLIDLFREDWQLSQFWYTDETAKILAQALLEGADSTTVVVVVSAPSVFAAIKQLPALEIPTPHIYLLEYDTRFQVLAGKDHFNFYDYNEPDSVPEKLRHQCDRLLIDPPFLNERCQSLSAQCARNLLKPGDGHRVISSTGERMNEILRELYPEARMTSFLPQHKNGLANEFRCNANFECRHWLFVEDG